MVRLAKAVFGCATVIALSTVAFVHYKQYDERKSLHDRSRALADKFKSNWTDSLLI